MAFKPFGPGSSTGAEGDALQAGNRDYYPSDKSGGYVTGGEPSGSSFKESSVPARPNPQSGNLSQEKANIKSFVQAGADYAGQDGNMNPTGSSAKNPEGSRTSEDAGFYGSRPESSAGTNAGGGGGSPKAGVSDPYSAQETKDDV